MSLIGRIMAFIQKTVSFILAVLIPVLIVVQVFLRYVLQAPLMGIEELLIFPTIWLYMLGGANASQQRNHISCGILTLYIKRPLTMKLFNISKALISLIVSIWLTYWSYWYFVYSLTRWKLSDLLYIPLFFGESAVFIGIVLMTIYTLGELVDYLKNLQPVLGPEKRDDAC